MLDLNEAIQRILGVVPPPVNERISLPEAHGRVLKANILSPMDVPAFDNSAMDGYAVLAADVAQASADHPIALRLVGQSAAGAVFNREITRGTCVRLFTGSLLPAGADAVVMQEDTRANGTEVLVLDAVKPWENVRFKGEDIKAGKTIAETGTRLTAAQLSLLAATGVVDLDAGKQPVVGLVATGTELKEPGQRLEAGQIYESNRVGLSALVVQSGGIPKVFPLIEDVLTSTSKALEEAFDECDIVVTSGGVSVGEFDFIKPAFERIGGHLEFWKVSIKPGRPFVLGRLGQKLLFGLPGNPVSAMVTFLLLVRPALLRWQGAMDVAPPTQSGVLADAISNDGNRQHYVRVQIDSSGNVRSAGIQSSHMLNSLAKADGLLAVPPNSRLEAGTRVNIVRWQ